MDCFGIVEEGRIVSRKKEIMSARAYGGALRPRKAGWGGMKHRHLGNCRSPGIRQNEMAPERVQLRRRSVSRAVANSIRRMPFHFMAHESIDWPQLF